MLFRSGDAVQSRHGLPQDRRARLARGGLRHHREDEDAGRGRGDLFATVQVRIPKKLTKDQRHLLDQLGKTLPAEKFEPRPHGEEQEERNLFDRVKDMFG